MRRWIALAALLALPPLLGCSIAPVVTDPAGESSRYADCRRAAKDYCRDAIGAMDAELRKCVARATYECISG